jgi:hypothetical protein
MLDQTRSESASNWPPYNIERISDDDYRITMALAGFAPDEIELVQKENTLFVGAIRTPTRSRALRSCTVGSPPGLSGRASIWRSTVKVVGDTDQDDHAGSKQSRVSARVATRLRRFTPR